MRINHNDAIELESQVRRLFNCDRSGVSGLADADYFESEPMYAAVMVVSYIHARGLQAEERQFDEFLAKYNSVFTYPDEYDMRLEIENYIKDLSRIIDDYV